MCSRRRRSDDVWCSDFSLFCFCVEADEDEKTRGRNETSWHKNRFCLLLQWLQSFSILGFDTLFNEWRRGYIRLFIREIWCSDRRIQRSKFQFLFCLQTTKSLSCVNSILYFHFIFLSESVLTVFSVRVQSFHVDLKNTSGTNDDSY